jgi:hypothetical protein
MFFLDLLWFADLLLGKIVKDCSENFMNTNSEVIFFFF